MVTFAQAQERADRWVNGGPGGEPRREVRVREFDLGFVAWAEDANGNSLGGGRLVIARDSGDTTLWPALPVSEVIRRYEEEYGAAADGQEPAAAEPERVDLHATSFLLTPPQWLQDAMAQADGGGGGAGGGSAVPAAPTPPPAGRPWAPPGQPAPAGAGRQAEPAGAPPVGAVA
ncbi:hypothetical protein ACFWI8_35755, partial [Streptomyces sp. NPDC127098]